MVESVELRAGGMAGALVELGRVKPSTENVVKPGEPAISDRNERTEGGSGNRTRERAPILSGDEFRMARRARSLFCVTIRHFRRRGDRGKVSGRV